MVEGVAISIKDVSKVYRLYQRPIDRLKEMLFRRRSHKEFIALNDLNIRVKKGETLGVVGENGAGKSTLLKIISKTLKPTGGEVEINGMVSSLLELGSGFHPEFTGIDNIHFYGSLLGIPSSEMKRRVQEVISFAEIGEHINYPLKTYSSGMQVRLAFSVAMAVEPDILVVDEALSVGDLYFQKKSTDKILSIKDKGNTIIFCSHSMYYINRLCDRVIWLKNGRVAMDGPASEVTQAYETYQLKKEADKRSETPQAVPLPSHETAVIAIHNLILTPCATVRSGDDLTVEMDIVSLDDSVPYRLAAVLFRIDELRILGIGTKAHELLYGNRKITLCFPSIQLKEGTFYLRIHVMDENFVHKYDTKATEPFTVPKEGMEPGFINLPYRWTV
ncbi:MAG: polysaccharide ABC transporter ATP-binding protein [Nitrospiraceae bacterium]|nr:polysaccharide ABC transporter ATP-binding protein [Nitrospiraceae bacterium]